MKPEMAPTDAAPEEIAGLPLGVLKPYQAAEGVVLSEEAGWNQTEDDLRLMIEAGTAYGLRDDDDLLAASALVLPQGDEFAWISMVLVSEDFRRRGIATELLRRCISEIEARGLVAGLDATPAGRTLYEPLGFQDIYPIHRLQAADGPRWASPLAVPAGVSIQPLVDEDMDDVARFDAPRFGGNRRRTLEHLRQRRPGSAWLARLDLTGEVAGYVMGRDGRESSQVGPLVAVDEEVATALADRALSGIGGPVYIDVAEHHEELNAWLPSRGFALQRPFTRMLKGRREPFEDPARVFAIAGPELG